MPLHSIFAVFTFFIRKKVLYCSPVLKSTVAIPTPMAHLRVGVTFYLKSNNSNPRGPFRGGGASRVVKLLHLPILVELDTVVRNLLTARGVLKKVADHFFQFTPGPAGFSRDLPKIRRERLVLCKYPTTSARKTRLKDRIEHSRVNLNVAPPKILVQVCTFLKVHFLKTLQSKASFKSASAKKYTFSL